MGSQGGWTEVPAGVSFQVAVSSLDSTAPAQRRCCCCTRRGQHTLNQEMRHELDFESSDNGLEQNLQANHMQEGWCRESAPEFDRSSPGEEVEKSNGNTSDDDRIPQNRAGINEFVNKAQFAEI